MYAESKDSPFECAPPRVVFPVPHQGKLVPGTGLHVRYVRNLSRPGVQAVEIREETGVVKTMSLDELERAAARKDLVAASILETLGA